MSLFTVNKLTTSVGAEVVGLDPDRLASDDQLGEAVLDALEDAGVLVFPGLNRDPHAQVAFCRRLGEIDHSSDGHHPVAGIYPITLDKSKNSSAGYLRATFDWHIDGCTPIGDEYPQKATVLSAVQVAERGGETEFASTYGAYDELSDDEKERFASLRVVHSLEASQRRVSPDPSPEEVARWRARPTHEHPLVWTHRSGRRSLVLGRRPTTSSAWTSPRAGRYWRTCSTGPPAPARSTATSGPSATPSSGTTAVSCTARRPMTPAHGGNAAYHCARRRADPVTGLPALSSCTAPSLTPTWHYGNLIPKDENHVLAA
jgi:alpha-ketoglutarate-dependent taurine dioxygenase